MMHWVCEHECMWISKVKWHKKFSSQSINEAVNMTVNLCIWSNHIKIHQRGVSLIPHWNGKQWAHSKYWALYVRHHARWSIHLLSDLPLEEVKCYYPHFTVGRNLANQYSAPNVAPRIKSWHVGCSTNHSSLLKLKNSRSYPCFQDACNFEFCCGAMKKDSV